jgi:hypothetical protein
MRIRVMSPVGEVKLERFAVPSLPGDWQGRVVGIVDNTKHNFDRLVLEMGELMKERWGVARVVHRKKANAATPAAHEIVEALAKECDVVFAGSAD